MVATMSVRETNAVEYPWLCENYQKMDTDTYLSGEQTAKINKCDITGIDITPKR